MSTVKLSLVCLVQSSCKSKLVQFYTRESVCKSQSFYFVSTASQMGRDVVHLKFARGHFG